MFLLVFYVFSLVSLFVFSELGSWKVSLLCAILQIFSLHTMAAESSSSLPPQHLVSTPNRIWSILRSHLQSTYFVYEESANEKQLLMFGKCRLCQEEDASTNFEDSCAYGQPWCFEKDEICKLLYHYGSTTLNPLVSIVWPSCSAILARFVHRGIGSVSSQRERSISLSSSVMERKFPPSPYSSSFEGTFGVQPQILPPFVDTLTGFKIRFLPNSTCFEPTFQSDSIMSVKPHLSDCTHVDFYEILQVFRDLKKCFILIFIFALIVVLVGFYALAEEIPASYLCCILKV